METKTLETKTGFFIDKNYLEKSFIDYDKDFLLRKYFLKSDGEEIKDALEEIEAGIIENTNKAKLNKYYLNSIEDLPPSAERADYNGIYIVFDSKSADAECKCFLYSVVEKEGKKEWMVLSAPSYLFETENIDYDKEFLKYKRKNMLSESSCFLNFNKLYEVTKAAAVNQSSDGRYVWDFYRNSKYNYEYLEISVTNNSVKYKSKDEENSEYEIISGDFNKLDEFAQTIFNYVEGE